MTRGQDFERQLADWLVEGPSTAPAEVVDQALQWTDGRRQRRGAFGWLYVRLDRFGLWFPAPRIARATVLAALIAGTLIASLLVSVPFSGTAPSPAPEADAEAPLVVTGTAVMDIVSETPEELIRSIDLEAGDPRIDGRARQELTVLVRSGGAAQLHGTMRLENDRGAWEGPIDIVHYPSGEEYEYASLRGSDTYEGFTYEYTVRHTTAEAERTVEGAIWPDEPPPLLDPSLLP